MMQEFVQRINDASNEAVEKIHTAMPGKISSYDASKGVATVQPTMKFKKPDGNTIDYPQITGVPVLIPQTMGQSATIGFPIKEGDECLIVVAEKSIDYWMYGQETDTDLSFDLTDAICIPGLFAKANSVEKEACDNNAIIIDVKGTRITVKDKNVIVDSDNVTVNCKKATVNADDTITAKAGNSATVSAGSSATVKAPSVTLDASTTTATGNLTVKGKVTAQGDVVANNSISLALHTHTGNLGNPTSPPIP